MSGQSLFPLFAGEDLLFAILNFSLVGQVLRIEHWHFWEEKEWVD